MKSHKISPRHTIFLCAVFIAVLAVGAFAFRPFSKTSSLQGGGKNNHVAVTSRANLPVVVSQVKKLKVESVTVDEGGANPVVRFVIRNKSKLDVTSFSISNGEVAEGQHGLTVSGLSDPDIPNVVLAAGNIKTVDIPLSNFDGRYPILISGATFSDGSEEGDLDTLEHVRQIRNHDKAEKEKRGKGEHQ